MYDRRPKSKFCWGSEPLAATIRYKTARLLADAGSLNEFWWLSTANVTSNRQATEILNEIPAALWRLAFSSLFAQKKFDWRSGWQAGWLFCSNRSFSAAPRHRPTVNRKCVVGANFVRPPLFAICVRFRATNGHYSRLSVQKMVRNIWFALSFLYNKFVYMYWLFHIYMVLW